VVKRSAGITSREERLKNFIIQTFKPCFLKTGASVYISLSKRSSKDLEYMNLDFVGFGEVNDVCCGILYLVLCKF
jgi:hypothetical protein